MHAIYIKNSSIFYKNGIWQIVQSTNSMGSHQIAVFNERSSPQIVGGPRQRVVLTLHAFTGWLIQKKIPLEIRRQKDEKD